MVFLFVTRRRFFTAIPGPLTGFILLLALPLNGCRPREITPGLPAPPPPKAGVSQESARLEGVELTYQDPQGETLWTVSAKEGAGAVSTMKAELKDVKCVLYSGGKPAWRCRADALTAEQPTKEVQLIGNVVGQSADGQRWFSVPSAKWDIDAHRITGGPNVRFRIGQVELTGDRLIASTEDQKGRVVGNVQGRILPSQ